MKPITRTLFPIQIVLVGAITLFSMQPTPAPQLPLHAVPNWAQLPTGWILGECAGVAVDKNDNVWVFSRGNHPVIEFDKNGHMIKTWNDIPLKTAHGIRVDNQGNVWLVDVAAHRVLKLSGDGNLLMMIGGIGGAPGDNDSKEGFNRPTNVGFGTDGNFFITDGYINSRVVKFSKDGDYLMHWGRKGTGNSEFNLVHDIAIDRTGRLFIADRTNSRVQIFDQDGKFLSKWELPGSPWGLAYIRSENNLYVADGENDRLLKVDLEGKILGVLGSHGKRLGQFDGPHSIAIDSTGAVYVAEVRNWRVDKFIH
jgi:DNA-binding beta-propeller fold protein YncE